MRSNVLCRLARTPPLRVVTQGTWESTESKAVQGFYSSFSYDTLQPVAVKNLRVTLLPFQKEGVGWMLERERFHVGGIMADHLGMGKTVQMIGLCVSSHENKKKHRPPQTRCSQGKVTGSRLLTVIRQLQKISVIANCSRINKPAADPRVLMETIGSLINASAAEKDYAHVRAEVDKWLDLASKVHPTYKKKAIDFLDDVEHRTFDNIDSKELRTLVVVPASLMMQWKSEIETKVSADRKSTVYLYYGTGKFISSTELENYDFVLTTYDTLTNSASGSFFQSPHASSIGFTRSTAGPLFQVYWKRIILDEAHMIRHASTLRWRAVRELQGIHRWAVTATPLHNSIEDLQNLLSFVGLPKLPVLPGKNSEDVLNDPLLQRSIASSLQPSFLRRGPVMMRNGKREVLVQLPAKHEKVVVGHFSAKESAMYNSILSRSRSALKASSSPEGPFHVFAMMTLLRQACCHRWISEGRALTVEVCGICNCDAAGCVKTKCGHAFCYECLLQRFREAADGDEPAARMPCPSCGISVSYHRMFRSSSMSSAERIAHLRTQDYETSTKLEMILRAIREMLLKHPGEKMLLFSHFTSFMDVISVALDKFEIAHLRLDGTMPLSNRSSIIQSFQASKNVFVMLASKTATGVGLNLTCANHVLVVDPWWNPAIEEQAVHRCYRIGQTKDVFVTRFIIADTIEQYCFEICQRKKEFGDAILKAATSGEVGARAAGSKLQELISRLRYVDAAPQGGIENSAAEPSTSPPALPVETSHTIGATSDN